MRVNLLVAADIEPDGASTLTEAQLRETVRTAIYNALKAAEGDGFVPHPLEADTSILLAQGKLRFLKRAGDNWIATDV